VREREGKGEREIDWARGRASVCAFERVFLRVCEREAELRRELLQLGHTAEQDRRQPRTCDPHKQSTHTPFRPAANSGIRAHEMLE